MADKTHIEWGEWVDSDNGPEDDGAYSGKPECRAPTNGTVRSGECGVDFFHGDHPMYRVGKKLAGRLLDGIEHNGYPEAP